MQHAAETLLTVALVWGLPVYLLDRRARRNNRPTWARVAIAFLMLFYFFIVPVFMALDLAGPKQPRESTRPAGPGPDPYTAYTHNYDPGPAHSGAQPHTEPRPSSSSHTSTFADAEQDRTYRREQFDLAQDRIRRERQQRQAQERRDAERRTAEREAQALQARRERQERAARERREREQQEILQRQARQEQADRERQAEDDLFMTWDERDEQELHE